MSVTVIISVYVIDFDEWKTKFDTIEMQRVAAGIHVKSYRNVDEPGAAYVIGSAPSKGGFYSVYNLPAAYEYSGQRHHHLPAGHHIPRRGIAETYQSR